MKPLEKLAVLLLLTFAFCGCTRTSEVKSEEKLAVQEEVHEKGRERTSETVQTGPGRKVVYKFGPPEGETGSASVNHAEPADRTSGSPATASVALPGDASIFRRGAALSRDVSASGPDNLPEHGPLVEMDVIDTGQVLDTKTASTQTAVDASLAEKQEKASDTKKKTSYWPPWWVWALGAVGVALGIAVLRKTLLGKAVAAAEAAAKEVL